MSSFANKHILITGGAGGIGLQMARRITRKGAAKLTLWDISADALEEAYHELNSYQTDIYTATVDIAETAQIYSAAERLIKEVGPVDILINNAGIIVGKPFEEQNRDEIEQTIRINLLGAMHVCRALLPEMQKQQSGHIVNIASAAGLVPNPKMSVYAGSKWGMIGWSESLRVELDQQTADIGVTTIEPSYINTGMFEGVTPPLLTPLLEPEDIADRIIQAVEKDKTHLRAPLMVKFIPLLKGILPQKVFDFVAGKLFMVYQSMDTFKGRTSTE